MGVFGFFKPNLEKMAADKDVDGLIHLLSHDDSEIQVLAAKALIQMGTFAQPKVVEALWSDNVMTRKGAAVILGKQGGIPAKAIIGIMYAGEEDCGKPAGDILRNLGDPAVSSLIRALEDDEPGVREGAIHALVLIGESARVQIIPALTNPSYRIRSGVSEVLQETRWKPGDEEEKIRFLIAQTNWSELVRLKKPAVPHLISLLGDPYYAIRKDAATALGKTMDLRGVPALILSLNDPDSDVRIAAIDALADIGDRKAIPPVVLALETSSYAVRMAAANALDRFGWKPQENRDRILYAIAKEQWQELAKMGTAAIPLLILALGDEYYGVRTGSATVLYDMGARATDALVEATKSQNPEIRKGSADILKRRKNAAACGAPLSGFSGGTSKPGPETGAGRLSPFASRDSSTGSGITQDPGLPLPRPVSQQSANSGIWTPSLRPQEFQEPSNRDSPSSGNPREFVAPKETCDEGPGKGGQVFQKPQNSGDPAGVKQLHEQEILRLIASLKDEDENVRMIAAEALGKMGEPAVLPLIEALSDPFYQVRVAVADILGDLADSRAEKPLQVTLKDEDEEVRTAAARALGKIGEPDSLIPLLQVCKDEYPLVRKTAVEAITQLGNSVIPVLIKVLHHDSSKVRSGAAMALGKMHAHDAVDPLIALFQDPNPDVCAVAEKALVEIGKPAFRPLTFAAHSPNGALRLGAIRVLSSFGEPGMEYLLEALNDSDPEIRAYAAGVIRGVGSEPEGCPTSSLPEVPAGSTVKTAEPHKEIPLPDAEPLKMHLISEPNPLIRMLDNPNKEVQINAAQALVSMGERAIPSLIESFSDENRDICTGVAETLVQMGKVAVEFLVAALQDPRPEVRAGAARTLGRIGDPHAITPLIQSMRDTSPLVRIASAESLGYLGDPISVEPLLLALKEPDGNFQRIALRALGYIGDERAVATLIDLMGSEDYSLRSIAIEALVEIGSPSVSPLQEALSHPVRDIRCGAADCLKQMGWSPYGDETKIPYLIALEEWSEIAMMGEPALPALEHLLSDADVDVRMGVVTALGRIRGTGDSVVHPLVQALSDENAMIRRKALGALIEVGEPAVESLTLAADLAASPATAQAIHQAIDRIHKRQAA